jgi:hypothetical protein
LIFFFSTTAANVETSSATIVQAKPLQWQHPRNPCASAMLATLTYPSGGDAFIPNF